MAYETDFNARPDAAGPELGSILGRRKGLLFLGLAAGLALAYLHHSRQPIFYRSSAQILVDKKSPPALPLDNVQQRSNYDDYSTIRTQELLIKSPLVLEGAVKQQRLTELPTLAGLDPALAISSNLNVDEVEPMSKVLRLTYLSPQPGDAQAVLAAVIDSYRDYLGETEQNVGEETRKLITQAKDELLTQINEKEAAYREFKQKASLLWVEDKGTNYYQERLARIENDRSEVLVERSKIGALLQSIHEALRQGKSREAILLMAGEAIENAEVSQGGQASPSPLQHLLPLYIERQDLMQNFGPDHPKVMAVNKRIEITRAFLTSANEQITSAAAETKPTDFLAVYIDSLEHQLAANQRREESLNKLFEEEQKKAKALSDDEVRDLTFRNEIKRTQQLFDAVVKRLEELSLVKDVGGFQVSVLSPPSIGQPVQLNLARTMAVGGLAGLLLGCLLAYVVDAASKTFYSADEISRALQIPLVGHIPLISSSQRRKAAAHSRLDPMLYAYALPRATVAEAYRAVRTALYFRTDGANHRVIQVTSPTPGDGKTTLAGNLSVTIAQSGKKVLLIDADFRKPRIHRLFRLSNDIGLASVIDGEAELNEAIQSTPVENLFVMPCGKQPHNPSELLSSPRFKELVDVMREKFDFVVIDTPPMLAVTDPSTIAPRVDGVLLTLRIQKGVRPRAERAAETLRSLGAEVLGIVVNGVGRSRAYRYDAGGYYYGAYNGYGSRPYGETPYGDDVEERAPVAAHSPNGRAH